MGSTTIMVVLLNDDIGVISKLDGIIESVVFFMCITQCEFNKSRSVLTNDFSLVSARKLFTHDLFDE